MPRALVNASGLARIHEHLYGVGGTAKKKIIMIPRGRHGLVMARGDSWRFDLPKLVPTCRNI